MEQIMGINCPRCFIMLAIWFVASFRSVFSKPIKHGFDEKSIYSYFLDWEFCWWKIDLESLLFCTVDGWIWVEALQKKSYHLVWSYLILGSGEAWAWIGGFLISIVLMLDLTGVVIFDATGCMFYLAMGLIIDAEFDPLLFTFFTAWWSLNA